MSSSEGTITAAKLENENVCNPVHGNVRLTVFENLLRSSYDKSDERLARVFCLGGA